MPSRSITTCAQGAVQPKSTWPDGLMGRLTARSQAVMQPTCSISQEHLEALNGTTLEHLDRLGHASVHFQFMFAAAPMRQSKSSQDVRCQLEHQGAAHVAPQKYSGVPPNEVLHVRCPVAPHDVTRASEISRNTTQWAPRSSTRGYTSSTQFKHPDTLLSNIVRARVYKYLPSCSSHACVLMCTAWYHSESTVEIFYTLTGHRHMNNET